MLDLQTINKLDAKSVGYFRFKKFDADNYLLTNEVGQYVFLKEPEFIQFITGRLNKKNQSYKELKDNLFVLDKNYVPAVIEKYREKYRFLKFGPSLHIIVVTLRCNHKCIYCHASAGGSEDKSLDMDLATAKKIVDMIFKANNDSIAIEFQGGEPLLNWTVVKFIVSYAREKNKLEKKDLLIRLVSNFSLMDDTKMKFLMDNNVHFCTSLDGNEEIHNYNRIYTEGNSFVETTKWIKRINKVYKNKLRNKKKNYFNVGAVITVTKKSFENPKAIIDTYINLDQRVIYLRYLNPYGFALAAKEKIWYSPAEFIEFYKKCLDYILENNYKGRFFTEFFAVTYLTKILFGKDLNNLDLRSPCGAAIGQLAYNYDGGVYTCDEGRMLGRMGDEMFKLGNINEDNFDKLLNNKLTKSICLASCTQASAGFSDNVYQPYLGTCPVYNYSVYNNIFQSCKNNVKYKIDEAIIEYLFEKLKNRKNKDIFETWVRKSAIWLFE